MAVSGPTAVFCLLAFLYVATRALLWYITPKPLQGIPHYTPIRPLGDVPRITSYMKNCPKGNPFRFDFFAQVSKDLGPIAQVFVFNQRVVVLSDHQEMEDVLARRTKEFDRASVLTKIFSTLTPHGLIALTTDAEFKKHRRYLYPSQSATNLARASPHMSRSIQHLCKIWDAKRRLFGQRGQERRFFRVDHDLGLCAWDMIGKIVLNEGLHGLNNLDTHIRSLSAGANFDDKKPLTEEDLVEYQSELLRAYELLFTHLATTAASLTPRLYGFYLRLLPSWRRARNLVFGHVHQKVKVAREKGMSEDTADSVLNMVLEAERKGVSEKMDMRELCDELVLLHFGGSETTQTTTRWALKFLARNPSVQYRLRQHLLDAGFPDDFEGRLPSFADVTSDKTPYLEAIVWESLRLARTGQHASREAMVDTQILGHAIPKGTLILFPLGYDGMTETSASKPRTEALDPLRSRTSVRTCGYWDEETVGDFRPERYLDESGAFSLKSGPNLAFSAGVRGCFGQKMAVLQLKMLIGMICMSFYLDKVPEEYDTDEAVIILSRQPRECYINPVPWSEVQVPPNVG